MYLFVHRLCRYAAGQRARVVFAASIIAWSAFADAPATRVSIRPTPAGGSDAAPAFTLQWDAVPNAIYQVQRRSGLEASTPWQTYDLVIPAGPQGIFKLTPEKVESGSENIRRGFIRLIAPDPQIFSVEPATAEAGT